MIWNPVRSFCWRGAHGRLARFVLLAGLIAFAAPALASEDVVPTNSEDTAVDEAAASTESAVDPIVATTEWMLEQDDPRLRAAALVVRTGAGGEVRTATVIDAIRGTTDGAAMLWLAHACQAARIQRQCIDAGLDDAIVRYDSANVFARAPLYPDDRMADLVQATRGESMHYFTLVEAWYDALTRGPAAELGDSPADRFAQAFAIGAAWAIPALGPLAETCRSATAGAELDRACQQLAGRMVDGGESMLGFMIGRAIQRRGDPADDEERAAATLASDRAACQFQALESTLNAMDDADIREFIGLLKRHGEFEAWDRLAEEHDVDCSDPPSLVAEYESQTAWFNENVAPIAERMMASSDDRQRTAGMAWILTNSTEPIEAPSALLDELEQQIRSITDPAALAWLAAACRNAAIVEFCRTAGLDAAIVEHDRGNLLARLPLLDETNLGAAIRESTRVRSYHDEAGATWYAEFDALGEQKLTEMGWADPESGRVPPVVVLTAAFVSPTMYTTPRIVLLTEHCGSTALASVDAAGCDRIADQLVENGRTMLEYQIGMGMKRASAERSGDQEAVHSLNSIKDHQMAVIGCQSLALQEIMDTMSRDEVEAWIAEQLEFGERRAYARAAERAGVDCSDPAPWPPDFTDEG